MVTNFFRIALPFEEFDIQRLPYSQETLHSLRQSHNREASFFKNGDFIYISPAKGAAVHLAKTTRLDISQNAEVVESLIRHLVFRVFRDAAPNRVPESFAPLRIISPRQEHDPLRAFLPSNLRGRIGFPRVTEIHTKTVWHGHVPTFGLVVYSRHRWSFGFPVADAVSEGFPLEGSTVLETVPIPGLDGVLAPDENLLGQVKAVDGDNAVIQTNDGEKTLPLTSLFLQRSRGQIGKYLAFKLGAPRATRILEQLRDFELERAHPPRFFREILDTVSWFTRQNFENADGFTFTVTNDSSFSDQNFKLSPTNLVFDYGPGASSLKPLGGLRKFGPFDSSSFDKKNLRILAIFHERNRGAATEFLGKLINGISDSQFFQKGFRDLFSLHRVDYELRPLSANFPEDYEKAIDEAVKSAPTTFDLALVECLDETREFPSPQNPYLRAKARLMSYGIPVQCVRETHLRSPTAFLAFSLGPTALQMYAKVGGTPWLLPSSQSVDRELIIGIGNTIQRANMWSGAEQSRIVGITTFFLGDGRYLLGQQLRSVPYEEYFAALLASLQESLLGVSAEYAWKDGETVHIVFHVFKPLKDVEVEVVQELVKRFSRFKILYAFVTISTKHPWMLFRSVTATSSGLQVDLCERGDNLILDTTSCLLQLRGASDRPNKKQRPPFPALIRVHEKSTYRDLQFIAQQIQDFSYLSWRSFYPNETPVTVFYSELMADMSSKLQRVEGWNPVHLERHFRRKKWFL